MYFFFTKFYLRMRYNEREMKFVVGKCLEILEDFNLFNNNRDILIFINERSHIKFEIYSENSSLLEVISLKFSRKLKRGIIESDDKRVEQFFAAPGECDFKSEFDILITPEIFRVHLNFHFQKQIILPQRYAMLTFLLNCQDMFFKLSDLKQIILLSIWSEKKNIYRNSLKFYYSTLSWTSNSLSLL